MWPAAGAAHSTKVTVCDICCVLAINRTAWVAGYPDAPLRANFDSCCVLATNRAVRRYQTSMQCGCMLTLMVAATCHTGSHSVRLAQHSATRWGR